MTQQMTQPLTQQTIPHPMQLEPRAVEYPSSDGKPVAETDVHIDELMELLNALKGFFKHDAGVYVAGNNFLYYEKGNPRAVFSPDTYVVRGVEKRERDKYLLWEEKQAPCFVLELSSRSTWKEDRGRKKRLCARLGVAEYFLYDPKQEWLRPPLQGYRLRPGRADYRLIEPREDGTIPSEQLGLLLRLNEQARLDCIDAKTGQKLRRYDEANVLADRTEEAEKQSSEAKKQRDKEKKRADKAERRAEQAEQRVDEAAKRAEAAERELARLRAELAKRGRS